MIGVSPCVGHGCGMWMLSEELHQIVRSSLNEGVHHLIRVCGLQVQAVLLLLGGREIPPGMSGVNVSSHHHHKVILLCTIFQECIRCLDTCTDMKPSKVKHCLVKVSSIRSNLSVL